MCPITSYYNDFPKDYLLVCPSNNEVLRLDEYWCNCDKFFDEKNETWLWNILATRTPNAKRIQHFYPQARRGGKLSLLEALPRELIEEILDAILSDDNRSAAVEDVLLFGLSSDRLWPTVLHRIHREYQRGLAANWAGKRAGFHGSFSYPTQAQLETYGTQSSIFVTHPWRYWCFKSYPGFPEYEYHESATAIQKACTQFSAKEWKQIRQDLSQAYLYPQDQVWVLRNLTKAQLVRSDKLCYPGGVLPPAIPKDTAAVEEATSRRLNITKLWKSMKGKGKEVVSRIPIVDEKNGYKPLTLAQVFLYLTCFNETYQIPYTESVLNFHDGPWTGHAFDLVTLEEHEADSTPTVGEYTENSKTLDDGEARKTNWEDVSEVVATDLGGMRKLVLEDKVMSLRARAGYPKPEWAMPILTKRMKDREWTGAPKTTVNTFSQIRSRYHVWN